jgi:hypothetical protein
MLVDSYASSNYDYDGSTSGMSRGQTFMNGADEVQLTSVKFWMNRSSSLYDGFARAKLFAMTGTYGVSGKPTGAALAVSSEVARNSLPTVSGWVEFTFPTPPTLQPNTPYCIVINCDVVGSSFRVGLDTSSPTHAGNYFDDGGSGETSWGVNAARDVIFEVYGTVVVEEPVEPTVTLRDYFMLPPQSGELVRIDMHIVDPSVLDYASPMALNHGDNCIEDKAITYPMADPIEVDRWILDGSYYIREEIPGANGEHVGYIGGSVSSSETITLYLDIHNPARIPAITIIWDRINNAWPTLFDVRVNWNAIAITGQVATGPITTIQLPEVTDVSMIEVTIHDWSVNLGRYHVERVMFGHIKSYYKSDLIELTNTKKMDTLNITSEPDVLDFTLNNVNSTLFNPLLEDSLDSFFVENQKVELYAGAKIEGVDTYQKIGTYLLNTWLTGGARAVFRALDYLSALDVDVVGTYFDTTLDVVASSLLNMAGIKYRASKMSSVLATKSIKIALGSNLKVRECLQMLASYAGLVLKADRDGDIVIVDVPALGNENTNPYISKSLAADPRLKMLNPAKIVNVSEYTYAVSPAEILVTVEVDVSGYMTINHDPAINITLDYNPAEVVVGETVITLDKTVVWVSPSIASPTIQLTGQRVVTSSRALSFGTTSKNGVIVNYNNLFITNSEDAEEVADRISAYYDRKLEFSSDWTQNPILEPMECVRLDTPYTATPLNARIQQQVIKFNGVYSGTTVTKTKASALVGSGEV